MELSSLTNDFIMHESMDDLKPEDTLVSKEDKAKINEEVSKKINKETLAEERILQELEKVNKTRHLPQQPRDLLKTLIVKGELRETFKLFGYDWTVRALDQNDILNIADFVNDSVSTLVGRLTTLSFYKVVFSIEAINGQDIYSFFPEILPEKFSTKAAYVIAVKKSLGVYFEGMPPIIIDSLNDAYTEVEKKRDEAMLALKNS
jgi:hypothetical protein